MGTRADFYVAKKENPENMEWLGSIAWDGYAIDEVESAKNEEEYRNLLDNFLKNRDDSTFPEMGWP